MKRLVDLLAPLGIAILLATFVAQAAEKRLPGRPSYYLAAGAALVLVHLVLRFEDLTRAIGRRQLRYGSNMVVFGAAVLGIIAALNYLALRNNKRWDLTKNRRYSLSDQTRKTLSGLKEDVKVLYFQRTAEMAAGRDRLVEYESLSRHFKVEWIDPLKSPARAQRYEARGPWPVIVLERGDKRERVTNDSEQDLTNALIKLQREGKKTVCFVEGEGERDPEDSGERGFSGAKSALEKGQYQTKKVFLLREKVVPSDCTVLALAGAEKDPLPEVTAAARGFVQAGGKLLVMVEPELKEATPNLTALLKEWNIEAGADVVVDVSGMGQLFGTGEFTPLAMQYPFHEITKDFKVTTAYHMARSMEAGKGTVENVTAQGLVQTSPNSWSESDVSMQGAVAFDAGKDRQGPVALAAVATVRAPSPSPSPSASPGASPPPEAAAEAKKEGRVAAFGDADWASNALLRFQGNQDLFLNTVAWLAEDADLISIRPQDPESQQLALTPRDFRLVVLGSLLVLPGIFLLGGIYAWWVRRA
jgi:ABC-type uncharacterized transport system involved in gliding motility auxiliary subunit